MASKAQAKKTYQHFVPAAKPVPNWYENYNFVLIENMQQLEQSFIDAGWTPGKSFMSFDTETTGLNFEELDLVGYSYCIDGKSTYYVPVDHFECPINLGEPAVEFIYQRMCEARQVFMYNARYDMRVFEYRGYKDYKARLDKIRWLYAKFDMSKVNVFDVMNAVFDSDSNDKLPSLKGSALHFLGYDMMHFDEVIAEAGNFYYLNPKNNFDAVYYAASDALCTYLLAIATLKYYQEAGMAGKLDNMVIYPLMHYESEKLWLDKEKLRTMYDECVKEVDRLEHEVYSSFGYQINLNSPVQVAQALERLGIDTGERTASGNMATGMHVLENLPQDLRDKFPALDAFLKYKEVNKLLTTYFKVYLKEAETKGYVRGSYKIHNVPTGRFSAGKDGKNTYFSNVNLQALPKPHVMMYDVFDLGSEYRNFFSKKNNIIMGYVFLPAKYDENKKHIVPDDPRYMGWAEGMNPHLNIRSCITGKMYEDSGDDEFLYCAADYAAQELRLAANISHEPTWENAFAEGRDVHKSCYSLDTEFLTRDTGFVTYDKITVDTLIAQYIPYEKIEWVEAGKAYYNSSDTMYHFVGNNTDLLVTPNHRMYCSYDKYNFIIETAEDLYNSNKDFYVISSDEKVLVRHKDCKVVVYDNEVKSVCYSVASGLLVVRRNNKVSVCGNTACQIWGEENYNKDYRKMAKGANFSILYGASAASFIDPLYKISTMAEAEEFYNNYKSKLPTLFQWIDMKQRQGRRNGTVYTYFGRPRRVKGYYDNGSASFANRTVINTQIQGTAADILKLVMIRLWKNLLNNPEYKNDVRFMITIHDEIGYSVRASKANELLGLIEDNQTLILKEWRVPIVTEGSMGWSVGGLFAFERIFDNEEKTKWHYVPKLDD